MESKFNAKCILNEINFSLEDKGWYFQENFLESEECDQISKISDDHYSKGHFEKSKIGKKILKSENLNIRSGEISWITEWGQNKSMIDLNTELIKIMNSMNKYFRFSLKRFESQFAIYNKGDFYKRHLDQHKFNPHRQISCCLYLSDCLKGGELILYARESKKEIAKVIQPRKGSLVIFSSRDIYHEVRVAYEPRLSITTWFRDDEILPLF